MELNIVLANNSNREVKTKKQLEMLLKKYDLSKWIFQKSIQINEKEIPHSHPVLTLNTVHLKNDNLLLSQFLHEQMHWFLSGKPKDIKNTAMEELGPLFPHLIINYLEYDALRQLIGKNMTKEIINNKPRYIELYKMVIQQEDKIREILEKYNILIL